MASRTILTATAWLVIAVGWPATTSNAGPRGRKAASAQGPSADQLRATAKQLVQVVSELRGLAAKRPVNMGVMARDRILVELRERLAKEYTEQEIAAESAVLKRLGLLPADMDYKQAVLQLLTDQVAGFYDPLKRRLNIAA